MTTPSIIEYTSLALGTMVTLGHRRDLNAGACIGQRPFTAFLDKFYRVCSCFLEIRLNIFLDEWVGSLCENWIWPAFEKAPAISGKN